MVAIAVLGCGRIGQMHADNIVAHRGARLAGVYDLVRDAAESVHQRHGVPVFERAEDAFASADVDAILIATPTATHVDYLEQSVRAGKPVLCEKPIDLSIDRVDGLKSRIAGTDVPIMLGFVRRFDPGHAAARAAAQEGDIGELHQVVITSRDPDIAPASYIETSGGIFRDMTIHDLDLARFMLGEPVVSVSAQGSRLVAPDLMARCGDYDTVVVSLQTDSGKQAVITNSRRAVYGYDQRVELFGSDGMLVSNNRLENLVSKHTAESTHVSAPLQHFFIERYAEAFNAEISHFVDVVNGDAPLSVGFEDGRIALILADACFQSVAERRAIDVVY